MVTDVQRDPRLEKRAWFKAEGFASLLCVPILLDDAVTGILSGSLQKVTIDRVLRLVEAAGLEAEIRIRRAT